MDNKAVVLGVHSVKANAPVYLIEIEVTGEIKEFEFNDVTQEDANLPRENWQAVYDERELEKKDNKLRCAFFFHYLDSSKPLLTSFGPIVLPRATSIPSHLNDIMYEEP